jgi:hypothetical protein
MNVAEPNLGLGLAFQHMQKRYSDMPPACPRVASCSAPSRTSRLAAVAPRGAILDRACARRSFGMAVGTGEWSFLIEQKEWD